MMWSTIEMSSRTFFIVFQVYSFLISFWSNFFLWFWRTFSIQVCHKILTDFNHNICLNGMQNNNIVLSCLMFFFCWDLNFNLRQRWQECARGLLRGWRIRKTLMQCWQHLTKLIWGLWEWWFSRWSGDVIWRTGKKNFNAVSHNRARP